MNSVPSSSIQHQQIDNSSIHPRGEDSNALAGDYSNKKSRDHLFEDILKAAEGKKSKREEGDDDAEEEEEDEDDSVCIIRQEDLIFNPESGLRRWLLSRGKKHCIDFEDEQLRKLRKYFASLDDDGSGSIGVDELEDPLIALGLVDNRQQV
mmetsp:Transcript_12860/g.21751  ORF Transcript_12860/g.21751 Transcript_12860/m.21751 type:complete len:151 (+) Transcript_12860:34-486(+)